MAQNVNQQVFPMSKKQRKKSYIATSWHRCVWYALKKLCHLFVGLLCIFRRRGEEVDSWNLRRTYSEPKYGICRAYNLQPHPFLSKNGISYSFLITFYNGIGLLVKSFLTCTYSFSISDILSLFKQNVAKSGTENLPTA